MTIDYVKPAFRADAFAGTARDYAKYRPPYPKKLIDALLNRVEVTGRNRVLDLACGPGRLAIPLTHSFREVWAIDLEPEMIVVGEEKARECGINNIKWMVGRAEDLEAEPDSFDLITIGEAFHRLDQRSIGARSLSWLRPGGCLAIVGGFGPANGDEPWQKIASRIGRKWKQNVDSGQKPGSGHELYRLIMNDLGFSEIEMCGFVEPYQWSVEAIIGYFYSTSVHSRRVLGESAQTFENDLRTALLEFDKAGEYRANIDFGFVIGRKPYMSKHCGEQPHAADAEERRR